MKKHNYFILFLLALFPLSALLADAHMGLNAGNEKTNSGRETQSVTENGTALIFNGMELASNLSHWAWGGSSFALEVGAGNIAGRNAMKWVQGDEWGSGWTGVGVTALPVFNLAATWQTDTATITLKVDAGVDTLRIQYEGGGGKVGTKFKPIADGAWHTYKFPLRQMVYQDNTSGFDSSNINVVGIMSNANSITGKVIYITDWWTGHPAITFPAIVFNGVAVPSRLAQFTWGQSTLGVEIGAGVVANSNALKWVQGNEWNNGWTGMGFNVSPGYDLGGAWPIDSVTFKLKCDTGVDTLRVQFESGAGKVGKKFKPIADGAWHTYSIPLREMVPQDNTTGFDSSNVTVIGMMAEATGIAGKVIYITDWWTGHPVFDVIPPNAPTGITPFTGTFQNVVTWVDVPGEAGEKYDIYYSLNPITDVKAPGVEVVKLGVAENLQLFEHLLYSPATNQNTIYYYAVTCSDAAGNTSAPGANTTALTNTAKGVPSFSLNPPTSFVADGALTEWAGITPIIMKPSDGSGHIVANTAVSGDADLTVKAYLAMDQQYMYVAFDIDDDVVAFTQTQTSYLNDCADLYVGLYNWHGMPHTSYQRGASPDYHFRFAKDRLFLDGGADSILAPGANYYWEEKSVPGYVVEAKIPFATLATKMKDSLFVPEDGKRLPLDFGINDADATGSREGIMTYSPYNEDQSWNNVSRWLYNWVGTKWFTVGVEDVKANDMSYALSQNYPNPFNPATKINYSVKQAGHVSMKIYDIMGREVATLINEVQTAGNHTVNFNAARLSSGVYFYTVVSGSFKETKKMVLLR